MRHILIIHGFGGGLHETEPLEAFLKSRGLNAASCLLEGHGKTRKDLTRTTYKDWILAAERELLKYSDTKNVIIVGFSMGGLLGVNLAKRYELAGVVSVNSPLWVWNFPVIISDVFNFDEGWNKRMKLYWKRSTNSSIKSCLDFARLKSKIRRNRDKIKTPLLVIQCERDEVSIPISAKYIAKMSENSEVFVVEGGSHQVFCECEKESGVIFEKIAEFIGRI